MFPSIHNLHKLGSKTLFLLANMLTPFFSLVSYFLSIKRCGGCPSNVAFECCGSRPADTRECRRCGGLCLWPIEEQSASHLSIVVAGPCL